MFLISLFYHLNNKKRDFYLSRYLDFGKYKLWKVIFARPHILYMLDTNPNIFYFQIHISVIYSKDVL